MTRWPPILERIFTEHFNLIETQVSPKENQELDSGSLQSADDLEATYRNKRGQGYRGYTANITETCDPDNALQLITKVQVAPNTVDDTQLLAEPLPDLEERTELETLYTDRGYGSLETDEALREKNVQQIQTAIRGQKPAAEKLHLSDFEIKQTEEGQPTQITCPQGQNVKVQSSSRKKSFVAHFDEERCRTCPFSSVCPPNLANETLAGITVSRRPRPCRPTAQAQSNSLERGQKPAGGCGSHGQTSQTSFPSRETTRQGSVQSRP